MVYFVSTASSYHTGGLLSDLFVEELRGRCLGYVKSRCAQTTGTVPQGKLRAVRRTSSAERKG